MPGFPKPPELRGAQLAHYMLFRQIGIHTFDVLGLAEPKRLYDRLTVEAKRYPAPVKLPSPKMLAIWVEQSLKFADDVRKTVGVANVKPAMFSLPGENQGERDPFPPKRPGTAQPRRP